MVGEALLHMVVVVVVVEHTESQLTASQSCNSITRGTMHRHANRVTPATTTPATSRSATSYPPSATTYPPPATSHQPLCITTWYVTPTYEVALRPRFDGRFSVPASSSAAAGAGRFERPASFPEAFMVRRGCDPLVVLVWMSTQQLPCTCYVSCCTVPKL